MECNEELEDKLGDEADECFIDEDGSFTDDEEIEEEMEEEYEEEQDYEQEED